MTKKFTLLIYKLVFFFLKVLDFIFKKEFSYHFKDFVNINSYDEIIIKNKSYMFFSPNTFTKWRLNTFYTKEPETLKWIDKFDKNSIFFDIGANIGLYSIYAAQKFSVKQIYAFEPSFINTRVLSRNISINKFSKKIKICQLALSNHKIKFEKMNENAFLEGGSFNSFGSKKNSFKSINFSGNQYYILGGSLDYLIKNKILPYPNYIKIDVDGIEHLILNGANKVLSSNNLKGILIELYKENFAQYNMSLKILKRHKFKLLRVDGLNYIFSK